MSKAFYSRLAATNLKKNLQIYIPYIISSVGIVMMFYIMLFLANDNWVKNSSSLSVVLSLGCIVIGIFAVILLFYTNSFIIKRRKKEFGLFNILGMEKRHIGKILAIESLYTGIFSIVCGIGLGILFSRLMLMILAKFLGFNMGINFSVSSNAVIITVILFICIFALTLLWNFAQIRLANPIQLLQGGKVGEKEPKTKWIMAIIGLALLGAAYYIALTTESPLSAISLFFLAVIFVIIGTYFLFIAGSIALLKILRKNKKYYYKLSHFTSISGMLYRMKQNAAGLASICILSTMVLVMISTTSSLFIGFEDVMNSSYPKQIFYKASAMDKATMDKGIASVYSCAEKNNVQISNMTGFTYYEKTYLFDGKAFTGRTNEYTEDNIVGVVYVPLAQYNETADNRLELNDNEVMVCFKQSKLDFTEFQINGNTYTVKCTADKIKNAESSIAIIDVLTMVVNDDDIKEICGDSYSVAGHSYIAFDTNLDSEGQKDFSEKALKQAGIDANWKNGDVEWYADVAANARETFLSVYGGLFFLGIFLGSMFIMATVMIIYYKQISEGYEDKNRFEIMQKVGMSNTEVKRAINSQILILFFLPLLSAVVHVAFSFKFIARLLLVMNFTNTPLYLACTAVTIIVFALIYTAVYALSAKAYYKIIK